jgi:hypothetical protein
MINNPNWRAGRLSMYQTAVILGCNMGDIAKLRAKGARLFDSTFPEASNGCTFDLNAILAWRAKRASTNPPVTDKPPIATSAVIGPAESLK